MPKPKQLPTRSPLTEEQIAKASYVGSPEHKDRRWWGGLPRGWTGADGKAHRPKREHTTICPKITEEDRREASRWVRKALNLGQFRYFEGDKTFPKHIWYRDIDGQFWFGFAINQVAGTYKGWPISEAEKRAAFN